MPVDRRSWRRSIQLCLTAVALLAAACGSTSTDTATGPTPVKCAVSLTTAEGAIDAAGGTGLVTVTTQPECAWTATSEASWIRELAPANGQGNGNVQFEVASNPDGRTRQAAININDQRAVVLQAASPCRFDLTLSNDHFPAGGGTATVTIAAPGGCEWSASATDSWIAIQPSAAGAGPGRVTFAVNANTGGARTGTISIGPQSVTVTQDAASQSPVTPTPTPTPCEFSVGPQTVAIAAAGGSAVVTVTTDVRCGWGVTSLVPWLVIDGNGGNGSGEVRITATPNSGSARAGSVVVAGNIVSVTQAGTSAVSCAASIDPSAQSVTAAGITGASVSVSIGSACPWTATSNAPWMSITGGASGTGNGTVVYDVSANTGAARQGTLTIANQTFTVSQAAAACTYSISPTSQSVAATAGSGTPVAVTTTANCAWTATSNVGWLTITSGASGAGSGTVAFTIAANTGAARTGTLTVAGQTVSVTQAAGNLACTYSISPNSRSVGPIGGVFTVAVTAPDGCAWTARSDTGWIAILTGSTGTGSGTVTFAVTPFSGSQRTGTLTIAGLTFTVTQSRDAADD